jgi:hypothetical protein
VDCAERITMSAARIAPPVTSARRVTTSLLGRLRKVGAEPLRREDWVTGRRMRALEDMESFRNRLATRAQCASTSDAKRGHASLLARAND